MMTRAVTLSLLLLLVPSASLAQSGSGSSLLPGDGPQVDDKSSSLGKLLSPWLPVTLLIAVETGVVSGNAYCIATRRCSSGARFASIGFTYGTGFLATVVGGISLAKDDKQVGFAALGIAALNVGLGLWNHLTPRRSPSERKLRVAPLLHKDAQGLLLSKRF